MTFDRRLWRRQERRERGVGPKALSDAELDVASLIAAGRFDSPAAFAVCVGLSHDRLSRALATGLTVWTADRYAMALGFHPCEVWGDVWWQAGARYEALDEMSEAG